MRILADENVAGDIVEALRGADHDVAWIAEDAPGSPDGAVVQRAIDGQRIVLTFDKGFGELAFLERLPNTIGVILIRAQTSDSIAMAKLVVDAIGSRADWAGYFCVVENSRMRIAPLPPTD